MPKEKTCPVCGVRFTPIRSLQKVCGFECSLKHSMKKREQSERMAEAAARKVIRLEKERIKTKADWRKEAQAECNKYVRIRDSDLPCISCGRFHQGQWHAGHYLSRGAHPELSLDPRNIHKQCQPCNTHLSGNQIEYRKGLIARYGVEYVEWLEGPHEPKKHSIDELKEIKAHFKKLVREAGNGRV